MNECECFIGQLGVAETTSRPVHAASTEVGAGRKRDHHVPVLIEEIPNISTVVLAHCIAGFKVAAPRIPASGRELIANPATVLTRHKNSGFHKNPTYRTMIHLVKGNLSWHGDFPVPRFPILDFRIPNSVWRMENPEYRTMIPHDPETDFGMIPERSQGM
jgi:hypothetical protein